MLVPARLMGLPEEGALSSETHMLADRLGALFTDACSSVMAPVLTWLGTGPVGRQDTGAFQVDELSHELSAWMASHVSETTGDGRTLLELGVLWDARLPTVDTVLSEGAEGFTRLVLLMHQMLVPGSTGYRIGAAGSTPDRKGVGIVYAPAEDIPGQLALLSEHWARHVDRRPGFAAAVAMTALMNLHPFMDGNGRVGRLLLQWTLNRHRPQPVYLPLHELSALSECGYLIRLRQAQYHGEWEPLFGYLVMVAERLFRDTVR